MIRLNGDYVLRQIRDDYIIVPVGKAALNFNGMITVNEVGAFLWEQLVDKTDRDKLLQNVIDNYEVTREEAEKDLDDFLSVLYDNLILIEELE